MRLTDDRISYLSHHIISALVREKMLIPAGEETLVQETKKILIKFLKGEEAIDQKVRTKISSIKRNILEGTEEWNILYEQYYNEEMSKLKS